MSDAPFFTASAKPPGRPRRGPLLVFLALVCAGALLGLALRGERAPESEEGSGAAGDAPSAPSSDPAGQPADLATEAPEEDPGAIRIESEPPGASLYVNGRLVGATPLTLSKLPHGRYGLRLEKDGRAPLATQLLSDGRTRVERLELPALKTGTLAVDIRPRGAEVLLNGELVGHSPLKLATVPVGQYELVIRKTNFETFATRVELLAGEQQAYEGFELKDKILAMMENQIRIEPQRVAHYIDLGHYHFVNNRMDASVDAFVKAQEVAEQPLEFLPEIEAEERALEMRLRNEDRARLPKEIQKHKHWQGANTAEFAEKLAQAEEIYSRLNIGSWTWVEMAANNLVQNRNYPAAEQLYVAHLEKDPNGAHALDCCAALLEVRLQQNKLSTAGDAFDRLFPLARNRPEILVDVGRMIVSFQNRVRFSDREELLEMAGKAFRRAYEAGRQGPLQAEAAFMLANVLVAQKHPVEALAYYKLAVEQAPDAKEKEERQYRLAEALRQAQRFEEAKAHFEELTKSESVTIREKARAGLILVRMARQE
ncbi:MAG: PEGA domain-containing protein [Planctomycetota bacterium]|nr:PEGA domain-containing protein [Planctomycetota bacterium]